MLFVFRLTPNVDLENGGFVGLGARLALQLQAFQPVGQFGLYIRPEVFRIVSVMERRLQGFRALAEAVGKTEFHKKAAPRSEKKSALPSTFSLGGDFTPPAERYSPGRTTTKNAVIWPRSFFSNMETSILDRRCSPEVGVRIFLTILQEYPQLAS